MKLVDFACATCAISRRASGSASGIGDLVQARLQRVLHVHRRAPGIEPSVPHFGWFPSLAPSTIGENPVARVGASLPLGGRRGGEKLGARLAGSIVAPSRTGQDRFLRVCARRLASSNDDAATEPRTRPGDAGLRVSDGRTTIVHVVGARPNFVKMAPVIAALEPRGAFRQVVVHTGPALRQPDVRRGAGRPRTSRAATSSWASARARHGEQTAKVLLGVREGAARGRARGRRRRRRRELHARLRAGGLQARASRSPTSRRACARSTGACPRRSTASSPTACRTCSSPTARRRADNLVAEGIGAGRVHYVGNTMIDSLRRCEGARARPRGVEPRSACASARTCS